MALTHHHHHSSPRVMAWSSQTGCCWERPSYNHMSLNSCILQKIVKFHRATVQLKRCDMRQPRLRFPTQSACSVEKQLAINPLTDHSSGPHHSSVRLPWWKLLWKQIRPSFRGIRSQLPNLVLLPKEGGQLHPKLEAISQLSWKKCGGCQFSISMAVNLYLYLCLYPFIYLYTHIYIYTFKPLAIHLGL